MLILLLSVVITGCVGEWTVDLEYSLNSEWVFMFHFAITVHGLQSGNILIKISTMSILLVRLNCDDLSMGTTLEPSERRQIVASVKR